MSAGATLTEIRQLIEYHQACGFADAEELLTFIKVFWGIHIPRARVCPEHTPPAEYVAASFFEATQDSICWANRSGGKTFNGALVTWLDSVFKPGCETKILGGSGEQSLRMYEHILSLITPPFQHLVEGEALRTRTHLVNGANIQILTASSKSVRGPHPQKLKLDEVDEFEDRIYEAALLIPKSARGIRAWESEMLCRMPSHEGLIYKEFDLSVHVV